MAVVALFAFAYSLLAGRLERTPFNGPLIYLGFGVLAGPVVLGLVELRIGVEAILVLAELTLAIVLFSDASKANLGTLRQAVRVPRRMLLIGLPLTILLGIGLGRWLFPELTFYEVAILATMLAPTDAALGKAVVSNPNVPEAAREGLSAESGLNDGLCVPVLFTFLALATQSGGDDGGVGIALELVAAQIGIGLLVGVSLAVGGAYGLRAALQRGWIPDVWIILPMAALAFASFCLTQLLGGSGFIACFVGGLFFGHIAREEKHAALEGAEGVGEAFSLIIWIIFGAAVVFQHSGLVHWRVVVYALLSLTVIRMLPVSLSLLGLGIGWDARLFLGWFGPRGLASIVFIILVAHEELAGREVLIGTVVVTVVLSVIAHGLSANPLAAWFGARRNAAA